MLLASSWEERSSFSIFRRICRLEVQYQMRWVGHALRPISKAIVFSCITVLATNWEPPHTPQLPQTYLFLSEIFRSFNFQLQYALSSFNLAFSNIKIMLKKGQVTTRSMQSGSQPYFNKLSIAMLLYGKFSPWKPLFWEEAPTSMPENTRLGVNNEKAPNQRQDHNFIHKNATVN